MDRGDRVQRDEGPNANRRFGLSDRGLGDVAHAPVFGLEAAESRKHEQRQAREPDVGADAHARRCEADDEERGGQAGLATGHQLAHGPGS